MDITRTVEPRSDQLNFDDVQAHPLTITITEVKQGSPEQPVELHNAEFPGRPYRPGKSMRRVLIAAWGTEASAYVGRMVTLYGDPTVKFGKDAVGGIRISHLSHIDRPLTVPLTVTRGKRAPFTVQPLQGSEAAIDRLSSAETLDALKDVWDTLAPQVKAAPDVLAAKDARKEQLSVPGGEAWAPVTEINP